MKKITALLLLISFLSGGFGNNRKFALVYFEYAPADLLVKIWPYGDSGIITASTKSEHIIKKKLDNGVAEVFLAYEFPMEKDISGYKYRYLVQFYKKYRYKGQDNLISIYSFILKVNSNTVKVKYEPLRSIPDKIKENDFSRTFKPYPNTKKYFIKQFNEDIFKLNSFFKKIYFKARLYDRSRDRLLQLKRPGSVRISLQKMEKSAATGSYTSRGKIDPVISVPLYEDLYVGAWPYKIKSYNSRRYKLTGFIVNGEKKFFKDKNVYNIIDFSEQWKNQVEQTLILENTSNVLDVYFDEKYFTLECLDPEGRMLKRETAPVAFYLPAYYGKSFKLSLNADTPEKNYLTRAAYTIGLTVPSGSKNTDLAGLITSGYSNLAGIYRQPYEILLKPVYKSGPFAIFTDPPGAVVKYKRIYSVEPNVSLPFQTGGDSPVYIEDFPYGLYQCEVEWYDNSGSSKKITSRRVVVFEFCDKNNNDYQPVKRLAQNNNIRYVNISRKEKHQRGYYNNILNNYRRVSYIQLRSLPLKNKPAALSRKEMQVLKQKIKKAVDNVLRLDHLVYGIKRVSGRYYLLVLLGGYEKGDAAGILPDVQKEYPDAFILEPSKKWKLLY